jgi:hypothetical protein
VTARDLEAARWDLGPWRAPSAIRFGRNGKPLFVQGAREDVARVLRTLERSVGSGNHEFSLAVDLVPAGSAG